MINTLFLLQYSLLNGLLIQQKWVQRKDDTLIGKILIALLISWSVNSLFLYIGLRALSLPFTQQTVLIISASMTVILFLLPRRQ